MTDPFDLLHDELVRAAARDQQPAKRAAWWTRRRGHPLAVALAALAVAGTATAAVLSHTSESSAPLVGVVPGKSAVAMRRPEQLVPGESYRIDVWPVLQGGTAGVCTNVMFRSDGGRHGFGEGVCDGPYPTTEMPFLGSRGWRIYPSGRIPAGGALEYFLTGPNVAALRIGTQLTVKPRREPGLPAGDRAAVFYLPAGSPMVATPWNTSHLLGRTHGVVPLTVTALDQRGKPIPITENATPFHLPSLFWHRPAHQPPGACALRAPAHFTALRGTVTFEVKRVPGAEGAALLSCLSVVYEVNATTITAAILLNARSPSSRPPAIFGASPVAGQPGMVNRENPSAGPTPSQEPFTARREGDAWIVVQGGEDLTQRTEILRALRIARVTLPGTHEATAAP